MAELPSLELLQSLHRDLLSVAEHRSEDPGVILEDVASPISQLGDLLDQPNRTTASRDAVLSGKITVSGEEYEINKNFQETALQLADELDLDEIETARLLLESEGDQATLGRSLIECANIHFHQRRKYILDCTRLCLQIASEEDFPSDVQEAFGALVHEHIYRERLPGAPQLPDHAKIVRRLISFMDDIKRWLLRLSERLGALNTVQANVEQFKETTEFTRVSLIQQHEIISIILCMAVEQGQATQADFLRFIIVCQKADKYDHLLVHLFPALGAFITRFGSTQGANDVFMSRELHKEIMKTEAASLWQLHYFQATFKAWWLAEYSGFYRDDVLENVYENVDLDAEERERWKDFATALSDGAFDFLLCIAADIKPPEWQDPARAGMRRWLQRKTPALAAETVQFSDPFQASVALQLEVFIDGFISNLPDVLRKLRIEEDEQRSLSQTHDQDLDLERFLIIIAYAYEGRADVAQQNFWADPESNLAGFLQWASRRASTPLVCAFCEMLQSLAEDEASATSAHNFLLDEGPQSTGQMRRSQSLTWTQVLRELTFFANKLSEAKTPPVPSTFRAGKNPADHLEAEPESSMMLECYLRLMTKLSSSSAAVRQYLMANNPSGDIVEAMYKLASSPIPDRLRACVFNALRSFLTDKTPDTGNRMWMCLDSWLSGAEMAPPFSEPRPTAVLNRALPTMEAMDLTLRQIGNGFEEPNAFVRFLAALLAPAASSNRLNDSLAFPEALGSSYRSAGVDPFTDFVLGHVLSFKANELTDQTHLKMLRLSCVEYCLVSLESFNEDLLVFSNNSSISIDAAIATSDLATYVKLHPFARVMEWMFNDRVVTALYNTIHQPVAEVGSAAPDSPLILGILRGIQVLTKVIDLQATFLDLVRPLVRQGTRRSGPIVANPAYASFEDGLVNHLNLIVDLGTYCGIGNPDLTLACLKLLEKISVSSRLISAWNPGPGVSIHRNKAIVALEANGESRAISGSLTSELTTPLDLAEEARSPNYMIKMYILDFLYFCLRATPDRPTIAHLLLGFHCGTDSLSIEAHSAFEERTSLFHNLFLILLESPYGDGDHGMRDWLVTLKYKTMRVLCILWSSALSAPIVLDELRQNDFLFGLLLREQIISPDLAWDGMDMQAPGFLLYDSSMTLINFLSLRAMTFSYIASELCSVAQSRLPTLKRRILDALNGQVKDDGVETYGTSTVFDLYDFLPQEPPPNLSAPNLTFFKDVDFTACLEDDQEAAPTYNLDKVQELLSLRRNEMGRGGALVTPDLAARLDREQAAAVEYLLYANRKALLVASRLRTLRAWTSLLLVAVEAQDLPPTARASFVLQALQAILPSLEAFGSDSPAEALELAKLAKVLLFKLEEPASSGGGEGEERGGGGFAQSQAARHNGAKVGSLVSDKLYQLFQICLAALCKWSTSAPLRSIYYSICCQYLTAAAASDHGRSVGGGGLVANSPAHRALKTVRAAGDRFFGVVCDDAYAGGDPACQTAALVLLGALVDLGKRRGAGPDGAAARKASPDDDGGYVVDMLNRLNFIGVVVDSLRNVMDEWEVIIRTGNVEQQHYQNAKLAFLLQLCQTREGAKHVLHANIFRAVESSGLYQQDPELLMPTALLPTQWGGRVIVPGGGPGDDALLKNLAALAAHYSLLAQVARVLAAAVVSRGGHNAPQGRRFLSDHRMLVAHVLKRAAGIGSGGGGGSSALRGGGGGRTRNGGPAVAAVEAELEDNVEDLAEALLLLVAATGFLEAEDAVVETSRRSATIFS